MKFKRLRAASESKTAQQIEESLLQTKNLINQQKEISRSMYCLAEVDGRIVQVILDSRSAGSIISKAFLQKLKGQVS